MTNFYYSISAIFWLVASPYVSADSSLKRFEFEEPHMGTQFRIILYASAEQGAGEAARTAFRRITELNGIMSDYQPASELMRLCQKAGGPAVPISDDLFLVLSYAQRVAKLSNGAFDVTVSPVVRLWRRTRRTQQMPDAEKLAQARDLVGYDKLILDKNTRTARLLKPGMQLDLGGIAKGYAADCALDELRKRGITRALVAAGGDIAVSAPPPNQEEGWRIGIAPLDSPGKTPTRFVLLRDSAVSTSGEAERFVEINGKRYSHIIDPRTGMALEGSQSVTIIAPKGITSDSLTKVVSVLGPEKGFPIVEQEGASALLVRKTSKGKEILKSNRYLQHVKEVTGLEVKETK